jgi:hypothetical protein
MLDAWYLEYALSKASSLGSRDCDACERHACSRMRIVSTLNIRNRRGGATEITNQFMMCSIKFQKGSLNVCWPNKDEV